MIRGSNFLEQAIPDIDPGPGGSPPVWIDGSFTRPPVPISQAPQGDSFVTPTDWGSGE